MNINVDKNAYTKPKPSHSSTVSCGGVVIFRNKVLLLYKNQKGRHMGWVLPKGTLEKNESHKSAALREVREESDVCARAVKYLGKTQYSFYPNGQSNIHHKINKIVHWYLMSANSYSCKPQAEEFFMDAGFYKQHEAYYLLKFHDERQIMLRAFMEYNINKHTSVIINTQNMYGEDDFQNATDKQLEAGAKITCQQ